MVLYSLVSAATLTWVYFAFKAAPTADLPGTGQLGWIIATALMIPALVLFASSFAGNPALPAPGAAAQAQSEPCGVFRVTRHPMMWSFAIWAASHIILFYSWRTMITAASMGVLALVGAHLQDRKKRTLMGGAWLTWESRTSFWPRLAKIFSVGLIWWALGLMLWLLLSWAHIPLGSVPAGIWLWF